MKNRLIALGIYTSVIAFLNKTIDPSQDGVLEIGCGEGDFANALKSAGFKKYQGSDPDQEKIKVAKNIAGLKARFRAKDNNDPTIINLKHDVIVSLDGATPYDIIPSGTRLVALTTNQPNWEACCLKLADKFAEGAKTVQHGEYFVTYGYRA